MQIKKNIFFSIALMFFSISIIITSAYFILQFSKPKLKLSNEEEIWLTNNNNKLTISGDPNYPPTDFINEKGIPDGISTEVIAIIENEINFKFVQKRYSDWSEVLSESKKGNLDVIRCIAKTNDRNSYLVFSDPYLTIPSIIVTSVYNKNIQAFNDLKDMKVGITEDFATFEYYSTKQNIFKIIPIINDEDGLQKVVSGELDAIMTDILTLSYITRQKKIPNLKIIGETEYSWNFRIACVPKQNFLISIINKIIKLRSKEIEEVIRNNWIQSEYKNYYQDSRIIYFTILTSLILSSIVMIFAIWDKSLRILVKAKTKELTNYKLHLEQLVEERTLKLAKANKKLKQLSIIDPLTKCYNRRYFYKMVKNEIQRSQRNNSFFTILMLDLDFFKQINDRYSHSTGDIVLKTLCNEIRKTSRKTHTFARLGGEEFYILMPDTILVEGILFAERLRKQIESIDTIKNGDITIKFTASFGVTQYKKEESVMQPIMERLDTALYIAKKNGRNRVEFL